MTMTRRSARLSVPQRQSRRRRRRDAADALAAVLATLVFVLAMFILGVLLIHSALR